MHLFYLPTYLISPMKNLFSSFSSLLVAAACALTLGSCNRAEYAMLPQGASYLGSTRVATPAAAPKPAVAPTSVTATPTETPAAAATPAVAAAPAETAPATSNAAEVVAPAATIPAAAAAPAKALGRTAAISAPTAPAKMTRVQRFAASKLLKSVARKIDSKQLSQRLDTAETQKVSSNLKLGIVLMVIGAIVALLPGLFRVLGLIIFIIGVLFLVLAILDMV